MNETHTKLTALLPATVNGWQSCEDDNYYTAENLHEYINGGAELYLSYGFRGALNRIYCRNDQPDIIADIFDMSSPETTFGVFMHGRETVEQQFGQGSEYAAGMLIFWKNNYFISLLASPETDESRTALFGLARIIEKEIGHDGPLPGLLKRLPQKGLIPESRRYFQHHIWLNSFYFISDENILGIDESSRALLAKYNMDRGKAVFLLVNYPTPEKAEAIGKRFNYHFFGDETTGSARLDDKTWSACRRYGRLLALVFNAADQNSTEALFKGLEKNLSRDK